jgi:hypothetical protein
LASEWRWLRAGHWPCRYFWQWGYGSLAKANPPKQQTHSWAIYPIRGTPAQFVGIVFDQPDQESAIKKAIEEYDIPADQHDRLIARRRD